MTPATAGFIATMETGLPSSLPQEQVALGDAEVDGCRPGLRAGVDHVAVGDEVVPPRSEPGRGRPRWRRTSRPGPGRGGSTTVVSECMAIAVRQRSEPPVRRVHVLGDGASRVPQRVDPGQLGVVLAATGQAAGRRRRARSAVHSIGHGDVRSAAAVTAPASSTPTASTGARAKLALERAGEDRRHHVVLDMCLQQRPHARARTRPGRVRAPSARDGQREAVTWSSWGLTSVTNRSRVRRASYRLMSPVGSMKQM